ncbi:MAG: hypothetical protein F8N37_20270 [Telmatospirillum sp.]|nr:hypothetical protein [Telmatospirillum sp.]
MPSTLTDLLARLRETGAPDRDIDFLIAEIVAGGGWAGRAYWRPEQEAPVPFRHADTYTASLDAAFALAEHMAPGQTVQLEWESGGPDARARIGAGPEERGPSPVLALLRALFAAMASAGPGGSGDRRPAENPGAGAP